MSPKRYGITQYSVEKLEVDEQLDQLIKVTMTYDWHGPTVTRDQLIEATQLAIDEVKRGSEALPAEIEAGAMQVAHKAHFITGGWQSEAVEQCGCLIGTLNLAAGRSAIDYSCGFHLDEEDTLNAINELAGSFPHYLGIVLREGAPDAFETFLVVD